MKKGATTVLGKQAEAARDYFPPGVGDVAGMEVSRMTMPDPTSATEIKFMISS